VYLCYNGAVLEKRKDIEQELILGMTLAKGHGSL
jgi:hypothetical protein